MTPTPQDHAQAVREATEAFAEAVKDFVVDSIWSGFAMPTGAIAKAVSSKRDALLAAVRAQAVAEERARCIKVVEAMPSSLARSHPHFAGYVSREDILVAFRAAQGASDA